MSAPPLTPSAWLRYDVIEPLLDRLTDVRRVLEIGAGQGAMGARLAERYQYLGVEPDRRSYEVAAERIQASGKGTVVNGYPSDIPSSVDPFDLVCAFEVLEHIEDDRGALTEWHGYLRPGGWLMLSVPAHQDRFGAMDAKVGHFRRYERDGLSRLLTECGFVRPKILTTGFPLGFILEAVRNRLADGSDEDARTPIDERSAQSGRLLQPPGSAGLLTRVATVPFRVMQRAFLSTDLGTGYVALARRSG